MSARADIDEAISRADGATARVIASGHCACCRPAVAIDLVTSALKPRGEWLDADGAPHARSLDDRT